MTGDFWFGVFCGAAGLFFLWLIMSSGSSTSSELTEAQRNCQFCKDKVRILAFRKDYSDEQRIAHYCPMCGRKIEVWKDGEDQ